MHTALTICVILGRLRCDLEYAWAALVKGPRRCQIGSGGIVLGIGMGTESLAIILDVAVSVSADCFCCGGCLFGDDDDEEEDCARR